MSVEFAGIPLGHEFTSLVLAILQVGGHPPRIEADVADAIRALNIDAHFETFFSLSCMKCPDVVQALNTISILNPRIRHTAIEGGAFTNEAERREVMSVPSLFRAGELFETGRVGIEQILSKLDSGAEARSVEQINAKEPFDVLVVGAGPAGAAAAI